MFDFIFLNIITLRLYLCLKDLRRLNTIAVKAANSGIIIVGGGVIKHHICNANMIVSISWYKYLICT